MNAEVRMVSLFIAHRSAFPQLADFFSSQRGWFTVIPMPGQSYQGPLPPLTNGQRTLEQELHSHVQQLAGQIGERNVFRHDRLVMAADYIRATLTHGGYEVRRQSYEVGGIACENVEAEVRGDQKPDEIIVIGAHYDSVQGSPGANDSCFP